MIRKGFETSQRSENGKCPSLHLAPRPPSLFGATHNLHASILCSVHLKNSKLFRFMGGKLYLHRAELADRLFLEGSLVIFPLKEAIVSSVMATVAPGLDVKTTVLS